MRLSNYMKSISFAAVLLALAPVPVLAAAPAVADAASVPAGKITAANMMPHRALYKMTLDSARNGSTVTGADGIMYFEWEDACTGWVIDQRMDLTFLHDNGDNVSIGSAYSTWEAKDGSRYRFTYRRLVNGELNESLRGSATMPEAGQPGLATYQGEESREVKLPAGTLFPTAHTIAMLNAAEHGDKLFNALMFDGTDTEGLSEISAVISKARPVQSELARTGWTADKKAEGFPIRMAFFSTSSDDGQPESAPDYEMDTAMLPNGVSEYLLIDYGDFKMRGTLEKVELLPAPKCGAE